MRMKGAASEDDSEKINGMDLKVLKELSSCEQRLYLVDQVIKMLEEEQPAQARQPVPMPEKKEAVYRAPIRRKVKPRTVDKPQVVLKPYPPKTDLIKKREAAYPQPFGVQVNPGNEWYILQWFAFMCVSAFVFCACIYYILPLMPVGWDTVKTILTYILAIICFISPFFIISRHNSKVRLIKMINDRIWETQLEIYEEDRRRIEAENEQEEREAENEYRHACQLIEEENQIMLQKAEEAYQNALRAAQAEAEQREESQWAADVKNAEFLYTREKHLNEAEFRRQLGKYRESVDIYEQNCVYDLIKREVLNSDAVVWKRAWKELEQQKEELFEKSGLYGSPEYRGLVFAALASYYLDTGICDSAEDVYQTYHFEIKNRCGIEDLSHIDGYIDELSDCSDVIRSIVTATKKERDSIREQYRFVVGEAVGSFLDYLKDVGVELHYVVMPAPEKDGKNGFVEKWKTRTPVRSVAKAYLQNS